MFLASSRLPSAPPRRRAAAKQERRGKALRVLHVCTLASRASARFIHPCLPAMI
jgi:hypothetical protein